jgi:YD repeat-containing protein
MSNFKFWKIFNFLFLFVFFRNEIVLGQYELPDQVLPSPLAMQFQKYGDYPVSHYTGIPDIKVPIYTIKEGDIEIPIYISFHASGLNLNEQPGIVGTGWTLHTGGAISRTINGLPDDQPYFVSIPDLESMFPPSNPYPYSSSYSYFSSLADEVNYEYDVYNYSFPGQNGKFLKVLLDLDTGSFRPHYRFKFKADDARIYSGVSLNGDDAFTIINNKGIVYEFGGEGNVELQDFSRPRGLGVTTAASTWYLGSVSSQKYSGMNVNYEYQEGPSLNFLGHNGVYLLDDYFVAGGKPEHWSEEEYNENLIFNFPHSIYTGDHYQSYSLRNYYCRVPQKISFSEGYLLFHLDSYKHLQKIEIFNKKNELLKTVNFLLEKEGRRLLKAVSFTDANANIAEAYKFDYYNENATIGAGSGDHWGFYNGFFLQNIEQKTVSQNYSYLVEGHPGIINFGVSGNDRNPNEEFAKTYMLQKITYPSGGFTVFDYEGNRLGHESPGFPQTLKLVGGLRIKEIKSYTGSNQLLPFNWKTYKYKSQWGTESGVETNPKDFYVEHSVIEGYYGFARRNTFHSNIPLNLMPKGAPIGYYEVQEIEGEATTTYNFDDGNAYVYDEVAGPGFFAYSPTLFHFKKMAHHYKPWVFGNLLSKSTIIPGRSILENYFYKDSTLITLTDLNFYKNITNIYGGSSSAHTNICDFNFAKRYHYSGLKRLESKTVSETNDNGTIVTTETYSYGNPLYPLQITNKQVINSKGDAVSVNYKYANNFSGPTYEDMEEKNMTNEVLEETVTNIGHNKEISKLKKEYTLIQPNPTNPAMAQLERVLTSFGGEPLDADVIVNKYDNKGHILQYTNKGGLITSYIYGYGQLYPIAKIVGADYDSVISHLNQTFLDSPTTSEADIRIHLSVLRTVFPNSEITTYTYKPLVGMTSMTDSKGMTTHYEYDGFQRLRSIKDSDGYIIKSYDYHYRPSTP